MTGRRAAAARWGAALGTAPSGRWSLLAERPGPAACASATRTAGRAGSTRMDDLPPAGEKGGAALKAVAGTRRRRTAAAAGRPAVAGRRAQMCAVCCSLLIPAPTRDIPREISSARRQKGGCCRPGPAEYCRSGPSGSCRPGRSGPSGCCRPGLLVPSRRTALLSGQVVRARVQHEFRARYANNFRPSSCARVPCNVPSAQIMQIIRCAQVMRTTVDHNCASCAAPGPAICAGYAHEPPRSVHRGLRCAERTRWIHADNAGCGPGLAAGGAPGAAAPARSGAGGADSDALVENQARTRLHVTHHGLGLARRRWGRTRADAAAVPVRLGRRSGGASEDWGRRGGTGGGPWPTDIEGPAGGVMRRLRCGRSTDSDGRDLRCTGSLSS